MKRDNILSLVSLAKKAGKISAGKVQTETAVKSGKAILVLLANDASCNTKNKLEKMCNYYQVPVYTYSTCEELGRSIGKECCAMLAVQDTGLAVTIEDKLLLAEKELREDRQ